MTRPFLHLCLLFCLDMPVDIPARIFLISSFMCRVHSFRKGLGYILKVGSGLLTLAKSSLNVPAQVKLRELLFNAHYNIYGKRILGEVASALV